MFTVVEWVCNRAGDLELFSHAFATSRLRGREKRCERFICPYFKVFFFSKKLTELGSDEMKRLL